ncbi:MAG: hypothetical protein ABW321_02460 [Polyangiales bacterium]
MLISDDDLLGSSKQSQLQLRPAEAIGVGTLVGAVFGAVIGAMTGHRLEQRLPSGQATLTHATRGLGKEPL